MKGISNPLAIAALERAMRAVQRGPAPTPRKANHSREADKFVVRGYAELFSEMTDMGLHQGRSLNSEVTAALLDALAGHHRSTALNNVLEQHLGEQVVDRIMSEVPLFVLASTQHDKRFVVRMPPKVRDTIRLGVEQMAKGSEAGERRMSMNEWMLNALVEWVNIQRRHYSLLTAAMAMDQTLIEHKP